VQLFDKMIDVILLILGFLALIIGTYTDLKIREVPDYVSYNLIIAGIFLRLIDSIIKSEWSSFYFSFLWFIAFVIIAYIMFYSGQWGGGDAKLLMGLGMIFAIYPTFLLSYFNPDLSIPFPLTFLLHIFIFGAVYGLLWSLVLAIRHRKSFSESYSKLRNESKLLRKISNILSYIFLLIALILLVIKLYLFAILFIILGIVPLIFTFLFLFAKSVEQSSMIKYVGTKDLTEGEWIVDEIYHKNQYICGPKDLGISSEQISLLRKYKITKVKVKQGIPFVPAFMIAAIISLVFGNLFLIF